MPPTATRKTSLMAIPAMLPATPESELSSEMVMGMSAPPTLTENQSPKRAEDTRVPARHDTMHDSPPIVPTMMKATVSSSHTRVHSECMGHSTGFCGSRRCSLPAATRLPTSVMVPTATASRAVK